VEGSSLGIENDLSVPPVKCNYLDNSPIFGFPMLWNNFDDIVIHSKTKFNSKLKNISKTVF
jgi:hypothetical protein